MTATSARGSGPDAQAVPGGAASTRTIAALTLKRLMRGRALWVGVIIASLPVLFASALRSQSGARAPDDVMGFQLLLLAVLPPMFVASSIGEEIEDRTTTYLWSRPLPRWAMLAGKLCALVPISIGFSVASFSLAALAGSSALPSAMPTVALAAGAAVIALVAAGIATLVPKHGLPLSIAYMLFFDLPVGVMPVSLAELSVSHQVLTIAGIAPDGSGDVVTAALALAVLGAVWLGVALIRIRRLEA